MVQVLGCLMASVESKGLNSACSREHLKKNKNVGGFSLVATRIVEGRKISRWRKQSRALNFRAGPWGWGPWHEVDPTIAQAGTVQLAKVMIYRRYKSVYKSWVPHKVCLLFVSSRTRHLPGALWPFWQENPFRMEVSVFDSKSLVAGKPMTSYCNEWCNLCNFFRLHKTPPKQKLDVHRYNGILQKAKNNQKENQRESSVKSQGHVATCCGF